MAKKKPALATKPETRRHARPAAGRIDTAAVSRIEAGRALRQATPRSAHAQLGTHAHGRDPIALIEASNAGRVEELIPLRHMRMMESPFAFFRGAAMVQAADLAHTLASGITVQACGDAHLLNFGGFATPDRDLAFDINDFDETFPAPWEWDLKRLAASLVLAARWRGISDGNARDAVLATTQRYRQRMHEYAGMSTMAVWYSRTSMAEAKQHARTRKDTKRQKDAKDTAHSPMFEQVSNKITTLADGDPAILDQPPLIHHPSTPGLHEEMRTFLQEYSATLREDHRSLFGRFRYVDAAVKVAGVGSVGARCFIALMLSEHDDPLFLQVKEARQSVLEPHLHASPWEHQGERVVAGQRLMQAASDIFLGWTRGARARDYYVRQLRDMKVSIDMETADAGLLGRYGALCGSALARAHAKAGQAAPISGYLGNGTSFDDALQHYAIGYADQAERDYETFRHEARNGRIRTEPSTSPVEVVPS